MKPRPRKGQGFREYTLLEYLLLAAAAFIVIASALTHF
jgi:hypothetical protein